MAVNVFRHLIFMNLLSSFWGTGCLLDMFGTEWGILRPPNFVGCTYWSFYSKPWLFNHLITVITREFYVPSFIFSEFFTHETSCNVLLIMKSRESFFFCIVTIICMTSQTLKQNFAGFWKILQKVHSRTIDVNNFTNSEFLCRFWRKKIKLMW